MSDSAVENGAQETSATTPAPESDFRVSIPRAKIVELLNIPLTRPPLFAIEGINKVHPSLIAPQLQKCQKSETIGALVACCEAAADRFRRMDVFQHVSFGLEPTAVTNNNGFGAEGAADAIAVDGSADQKFQQTPEHHPHDRDLAFRDIVVRWVLPEKRSSHEIGVFTTDSAMPEIRVAMKNILGRAWSVKGNYTPPTSTRHSWNVSLVTQNPFIGHSWEAFVGQSTLSHAEIHSADAESVLECKLQAESFGQASHHVFSIGAQRRNLHSTFAEEERR